MHTFPFRVNGSGQFPSFFDELFKDIERVIPAAVKDSDGYRTLPVDVRELEDRFMITADVPGVQKEAIDITVHKEKLTVSVKPAVKDEKETFLLRERREVPRSRTLVLGQVKADGIEAQLKDGVLTITALKDEARQPKKIAIS